ncbi:hypothetical protein QMK19_37665 [Streptomyces sp. H10-C2]|uniref:hypothetical protein n=1 Tax=unclassified Streptomyces TaxID=2593676 RepID=UPI0024B8F45B|nr:MULTISPECIES: hypothetical protein [unclassified Streptomyces]MDJ0346871.1 hypothetical protein [Streptomyces sp. PH10-H1]MDJ0375181.1 hypothetical protein [Streptomyces sp. H10-C2]
MHAVSVAEANDALRAYLHAHGSRAWTPAELAELERLRAAFLAAQRAGYGKAA